jgi:hypothetical protein
MVRDGIEGIRNRLQGLKFLSEEMPNHTLHLLQTLLAEE